MTSLHRVFAVLALASPLIPACTSSNTPGPSAGGAGGAGAGGYGASGTSKGGAGGLGGGVGGAAGGVPGGSGGTSHAGGSGGTAGGPGSSTTLADGSTAEAGNPVTSDGGGSVDAGDPYPLLKVIAQFAAADIPPRGPSEADKPPNKSWTAPDAPPTLVGGGLGRHPMIYIGEYYNRIHVVNEGKVVWTFDNKGGNLDDVWMLSNGHVMYTAGDFVEEITPKKEVVWHFAAPAGTAIHTCQPIGLDKVLMVISTPPQARFVIHNKTTKTMEVDQSVNGGGNLDSQFRRARLTAAGTYLGAFMALHTVMEYDKDFKLIFSFQGTWPWFATRLKNGNTMVQDESDAAAREVDPTGKVVWELLKKNITLPAGSALDDRNQTCERLANGNTVMFGHGKGPGSVQAVEVTPAKEVVWILQDWKNLGPGTSAQFLDQPGYPEVPGDTNH